MSVCLCVCVCVKFVRPLRRKTGGANGVKFCTGILMGGGTKQGYLLKNFDIGIIGKKSALVDAFVILLRHLKPT